MAAVGLLTVEGLSTISQTAILIALTTALASLVMSVTFVWRYQRQLTNIHDLRKIMASTRTLCIMRIH
ncbi:putative transmembrane protein [Rhizoctonia solani 123E]|uniref:Putative transmembrane protein n=1 Tax=Rhizoctonia solani 123E TaxID=1423351 RepID=A0A074S5I3_9AGAM|nr:putative transmembrane protein [Rhizoctonia solani 123E]